MHLHTMTPFGIVCPIETGQLTDVQICESMVRRQGIIIERCCVIRRLRLFLLPPFSFLGLIAFIIGVVVFFI
jgi:hypothetical protein